MSKKQPPKIAKNLSAKTKGSFSWDLGNQAFGKVRIVNGKAVKEE